MAQNRSRRRSRKRAAQARDAGQSERDPALRAAIRGVALTGVVFTVAALLATTARTAIGVGTGAVIATVNLIVFARVGEALIARRGATAPWAAVAMIKLVVLLGGVWLILRHGYVSALPLAIGFGALPVGIVLGTLFGPKPPPLDSVE